MKRLLLVSCALLAACAVRPESPVPIRLNEDACAFCRMAIVSVSTAAQIVTPGEEPIMFDEIGCLQQYLAAHPVADPAAVFVADHRTGEWVKAKDAVFTKTAVPTPMASGLLAHADTASRDADRAAAGGSPVEVASIIGTPRESGAR